MRRRHALFAVLVFTACTSSDAPADAGGVADAGTLPLADLMDPETCKDCHPRHYREWASSMHAYASEDPVFRAMNERGQRETDGELGDFCVKCHAPMAVREGFTDDGLDLDQAPDHVKGITCYFCHNVVAVEGEHDNPLVLANDTTMRGSILDPVRPSAHGVEYSPLLDGYVHESSSMCGACHDIVNPNGVHLERTFAEWKHSVFGSDTVFEGFVSCNQCHMHKRDGIAADDPDSMVGQRELHEHLWAGIDVALTPFPDAEVQRKAVEFELSTTVIARLVVEDPTQTTVILESQSGHRTPSGATQDRRMWVEFVAYDANGNVIFASGDVADDEIVDKPEGDPERDPHLWIFRDYIFDEAGEETHMFWEAAPSEAHPDGYESNTMPGTIEFGVAHTVPKSYPVFNPARVTMRVRVRPMGLDVLDDLIASGDLDPTIRDAMPSHTLGGTVLEWTEAEHGFGAEVKRPKVSPPGNESYRCLIDPDAIECATEAME